MSHGVMADAVGDEVAAAAAAAAVIPGYLQSTLNGLVCFLLDMLVVPSPRHRSGSSAPEPVQVYSLPA